MYILPSFKTLSFETKLWEIEERNRFETVRKIVHHLESLYIIWKILNHPERSKSVQTVMKVLGQFNSFFFCFTQKKLSGCAHATRLRMFLCVCLHFKTITQNQMDSNHFYFILVDWISNTTWFAISSVGASGHHSQGGPEKNIVFRSFSFFVVVRLIYFKWITLEVKA